MGEKENKKSLKRKREEKKNEIQEKENEKRKRTKMNLKSLHPSVKKMALKKSAPVKSEDPETTQSVPVGLVPKEPISIEGERNLVEEVAKLLDTLKQLEQKAEQRRLQKSSSLNKRLQRLEGLDESKNGINGPSDISAAESVHSVANLN